MRIAIVDPGAIPIPPETYGGVERIVHAMVHAAGEQGHTVTLFAHPDSEVDCELIPYGWGRGGQKHGLLSRSLTIWPEMLKRRFDVAHSFAYRFLPVLPLLGRVPLIRSFQLPVQDTLKLKAESLIAGQKLVFTACSRSCAEPARNTGEWRVIYNCVPIGNYDFAEHLGKQPYLAFLGRFDRCKGAHHAISVARATGLPLKMAGIMGLTEESPAYFNSEIAPHIDGEQIQYVGSVDEEEKNTFLGGALAFLMPIEWEEPFGIVMAEALACGTPVVGFSRGSVPEVVRHEQTGYVCESLEDMIQNVRRVKEIDRKTCREDAEDRFSQQVITRQYLDLYSEVWHRCR